MLTDATTLAFSAEQQECLLRHVAAAIGAAVLGEEAPVVADDLATLRVSGTFISLKRGKHLRSCCGGMQAAPTTLATLLPDAITRAVFDDPRFPPLSPSELPYLDVEIWLLFNPRRIEARGEERAAEVVTGGKHGLTIRYRDARGLLLPGVAAEHGWDARTFLAHVCQKAGLHASRWLDDETHLSTFEGISFRAPLAQPALDSPAFLAPAQMAAYTAFCRENLQALLLGGTPRYGAPGLPDGTVSGLLLSFDPGNGEPAAQWSRLDLQRGVALQATLLQLTQAAAQALGRSGASDADLERAHLTVLYDPALHGTVDDPDLRGFVPGRRAVAVFERGKCGLVHDAQLSPAALVHAAAEQAAVKEPSAAALFSFAADTLQRSVRHAVRPRPARGSNVRPPAVAGTFYPAEPQALAQLVDDLLAGPCRPERWPAAMVPHAGLRFSGRVAAAVLQRLELPRTIVVIGPKHTPHGMDWAIAPHQEWLIPGARIAADVELAGKLAAAVPNLALDAAAHQQEHGIEVELPLLARLAPRSRVVGIAIGHATLADCLHIADGLAGVIRDLTEPPLLLISSDMNHFANDAETRRLDEQALACLDRLDPAALFTTCRERHITMCGVAPAVIVLETLQRLGRLQRSERVAYATSADTTGDTSRVVGYAGMLFGG